MPNSTTSSRCGSLAWRSTPAETTSLNGWFTPHDFSANFRGWQFPLNAFALPLAKRCVDSFNPGVAQQQSLQQSVSYSGVGLHSGNRVNMSFHPAAPNRGIRFRRVDLDGKPEIEARIENV